MQRSGQRRRSPAAALRAGYCLLATLGLMALLAGCASSHSGASPGQGTGAYCGKARTAAHVPIRIHVIRGHVACAIAMSVERGYASAVAAGKAPGAGGGGPVHVSGWTCTAFTTPVVLQTGKASKCVRDGSEILAVLPPVPA